MSEIDKLSTGDPKVYEIFRSIAKWFDSIYYIDLVDGSFYSMIQAGGRAPLDLPENGNYARMIGHLADTVVYPGDREIYVRQLDMKHIASYLKSHDCQEFEYRSVMPDGTYHWYLNTIVVLRADKDGTPLAAASLVRDIHHKKTEVLAAQRRQKAVEQALAEEHRRIQMLAEATNAVVIYYDIQRNTARTLLNERRKKDTSRLVELLHTDIHKEWRAIIHPEDFDRFLSLFLEGRHLEEPFSIRARLRYDASYRWYRVTGRAVCDDERRPLRIVAIHSQISIKGSYDDLYHALQNVIAGEQKALFAESFNLDQMQIDSLKDGSKVLEFQRSIDGEYQWVNCYLLKMPDRALGRECPL